jgi:hypothetical protein
MKFIPAILLACTALSASAQCPVQIHDVTARSKFLAVVAGIGDRSWAERDPWDSYLFTHFYNTGNKPIQAIAFRAVFGDVLNTDQPSIYTYNWYGKVKPGKHNFAVWADGVYTHGMHNPEVTLIPIKVVYTDGTSEVCK